MRAEQGVKEINEVKKRNRRIAAFFDLDGTLIPWPSLEQRFFRMLSCRREIPLQSYFSWLREAMRLLPQGITVIAHADKMYLRDVRSFDERGGENRITTPLHKSGRASQPSESRDEGQPSTPPTHNPRCPVPLFFQEAVERVACHVCQGHAIVIVSGTLEPLAANATRALEVELEARGVATKVRLCATRLEEIDGRWTGRILGEAMFGEAKARTVRALAKEMRLDLSQCWGYGDSAADRWMLMAVGNPACLNPTGRLGQIARKRGWPVYRAVNAAPETQERPLSMEPCG